MKNFVVTANYRERGNMFRWLFRVATFSVQSVAAVRSIVATDVEFGPANEDERRAGCETVAHAEGVTHTFDDCVIPANAQQIKSWCGGFYIVSTSRDIDGAESLYLTGDGKMYVVNPKLRR